MTFNNSNNNTYRKIQHKNNKWNYQKNNNKFLSNSKSKYYSNTYKTNNKIYNKNNLIDFSSN